MSVLASASPPGCLVEVGVYKGGSAWHLAKIAAIQNRTLHLFDTFSGIPFSDEVDNHHEGDFADTSLVAVRAAIPDAVFHVGEFPATLPDDLVGIAFVHVDCDQYRSTQDAIACLFPRIVVRGVMLFDDYDCTRGATLAVQEAFGNAVERTTMGRAYVRKHV